MIYLFDGHKFIGNNEDSVEDDEIYVNDEEQEEEVLPEEEELDPTTILMPNLMKLIRLKKLDQDLESISSKTSML